jgi:transposase-like protein
MKKQRHHYELEYKRRIVQEYLTGVVSAEELARREADRCWGWFPVTRRYEI